MSYTIKYKTDSVTGPEFQKIGKNQGWVEYLNTLGQLYYFPQLNQQYYNNLRQNLILNMRDYVLSRNRPSYLGWIHHLAQQRLIDKFVLPVFGLLDKDTGLHIQCGNSRIDASIICGVGADEIAMIAFSADRRYVDAPAVRLQSTQQFNDTFNLNTIDYQIVFEESDTSRITFQNSVLRHTVYESPPEDTKHYSAASVDCISFWEQFQSTDGQIEIQIHCTEQTRSHIVLSKLFKVEYINRNASEWEMSYGMMLGAFNEKHRNIKSKSKLQLWLYDVTEPVHLELMIPWMSIQHNFYKTQNEKAVIIYGENQSNGLQVIGNWVQ